jgi:transcriptional regulator with XRE-family HTH domain
MEVLLLCQIHLSGSRRVKTTTSEVNDRITFGRYPENMSKFAEVLKTLRKARRFSQVDLAAEADVSLRHLSFLETGRSRPSGEMVRKLSDAMQLPLAARNQLLTHAGFAAQHAARTWSADEMKPIRAAVEHTLAGHEPYPGLVVDRLWNVVQMNEPARVMFAQMNVGKGDSLLEMMLSETLPPLIENWPDVAHQAALRLRTESAAQGGVPELDRVADRLWQHGAHTRPQSGPIIPTIYRLGAQRLSLFATLAQFGTPEDLTLDDLRIELYFPMDDETARVLQSAAV